LSNFIYRLRCRFQLFRLSYFTRDVKLRSLIRKLHIEGFDFVQFGQSIRYHPVRWSLFLEALLHRSYLPTVEDKWKSNERLEFLGDAILNFVVADHLYRLYPHIEEGALTKMRARLVNRRILANRAREIHLPEFLLLSPSAAQSLDGGSESIISDAYEAVVGAIYLDGGLEEVKRFIDTSLLQNPETCSFALLDENFKSALLEYSQGRSIGIPRYGVVREEGPEHDRRFTVVVTIGGRPMGYGTGRTKKIAEQSAAEDALERLRKEPLINQPENTHASDEK